MPDAPPSVQANDLAEYAVKAGAAAEWKAVSMAVILHAEKRTGENKRQPPKNPRLVSSISATVSYSLLSSIRRISLAYSNPGLASVELVQAILRQGTFIEKMVNMGWTTGGRFDAPKAQATLVRCIARYHGFLWLMATMFPGHLLVPTLVCLSSMLIMPL